MVSVCVCVLKRWVFALKTQGSEEKLSYRTIEHQPMETTIVWIGCDTLHSQHQQWSTLLADYSELPAIDWIMGVNS